MPTDTIPASRIARVLRPPRPVRAFLLADIAHAAAFNDEMPQGISGEQLLAAITVALKGVVGLNCLGRQPADPLRIDLGTGYHLVCHVEAAQ